jgi:hypothetical protein
MDNSNNEHKLFSLNKFRKIKENCYNKKTDCEQTAKKYIQTNPRFPKFDQVYFHAGDMKDMNKYGLLPLRYFYSKENNEETIKKDIKKDMKKNIKNIKDKTKEQLLTKVDPIYKLYKNIDYTSVLNSFHYMFDKFKKGIFVIIRNNKLVVFLPFSNINYKNNWYKKTYFSLEEKKLLETEDYNKIKKQLDQNIIDFQRKYPDQFNGHKRKINFQRRDWYANNCNFRNQFPTYEGETNNNVYKNMLDELLKERTIPDVEFFINDRDFPILKKDFTEPYEHIFDSENIKIEDKYQYKKMAPIFSQSITNGFVDMLMPTSDEWIMASNKYFSSKCTDAYDKSTMSKINTDWKSKKPICIFRGSATGCGMTIQNNMRLKAADLSMDHTDILDAGIIDWNARMKKYKGTPIQIIDTTKFRFSLANKINNVEKSNYKYILNIDGHVSAFRLPSELSMNSVVLIVASKYKMWFSNLLIPFTHYVPVKDDLSDLIDQINWCVKNDAKCKKIASNGVEFYNKYLTKDGLFNYIEQQLNLVYYNKKLDNLLSIKKSKKNIALITCFRDKGNGQREKQRKIFIQLMSKLLYPYCNFHIYIVEQSNDGELFNIGKLKNIGFELANKEQKYDNFIFSDIDTIPDYDLIEYFLKPEKYPVALGIRGTRYQEKDNRIKKPFLGALCGFTKSVYTKVNGYPNNFWGWGGEDDALITRFSNSDTEKIYYPKVGSIIDMEEGKNMSTINVKTKVQGETKDLIKYEKLYEDLSSWNKNGVNSLEYLILERNEINRVTSQIKVDLLKKSDEKKHPNWFPTGLNNFNKIKKLVSEKWYDAVIEYI